MSHWVCKLCIIQKGLKGADLGQWPEAPDDAWIAEHLRTAHGVEVREATDEEQAAALLKAVGNVEHAWVPFEERPRPVELSRVIITLDRMKKIEIASDDEAAIGNIFAWLMGQVSLARRGKLSRQAIKSTLAARRSGGSVEAVKAMVEDIRRLTSVLAREGVEPSPEEAEAWDRIDELLAQIAEEGPQP
jgi:hypothetical protein